MYNVNSMKRFLKILVVITSFFQVVNLYGQSILNQYDEQGNKHGQWVKDSPGGKEICNYNHGVKDGTACVYSNGILVSSCEYKDGKYVSIYSFDRGILKNYFYDFRYVPLYTPHRSYIGKCKSRTYHPNGIIETSCTIYFTDDGPQNDNAYSPEVRHYDEQGLLYMIKYYSLDNNKLSDVWYYDETGNNSKDEVCNFDDIVRYLSRNKVRHIGVKGDKPTIKYDYVSGIKGYQTLGRRIDHSDLIDYKNDTICIFKLGSLVAITKEPHVELYCKKGLYKIEDSITPIIYSEDFCGAKRRAQDEEMRKKYYSDLDAAPFSYDWMMMLYRCYDEKKLLKNHGGPIADIYQSLFRIIIKDNRIVHCDRWEW